MVGEEAEAGATVEGGEEAGGGVIAGAGEASLPGEIILANSCRVPNASISSFRLFRGGGDNKRKTFDD